MEYAIIRYFIKHFFRSYQFNNTELSDDHKEYFRDILPQDSGNIYIYINFSSTVTAKPLIWYNKNAL